MCIKCIPLHHTHHQKPIKYFNNLQASELQEDEVVNLNINKILTKFKALRVNFDISLDKIEESIKGMKSVSLNTLIDSVMK